MIGWILDDLPSIPVLETNIHSKASARETNLAQHERTTAPFQFLLQTIRPKVILVHGDKAIDVIDQQVANSKNPVAAIKTKHLRFWSRDRVAALAKSIQEELESTMVNHVLHY